jgi:hypothetical protein
MQSSIFMFNHVPFLYMTEIVPQCLEVKRYEKQR